MEYGHGLCELSPLLLRCNESSQSSNLSHSTKTDHIQLGRLVDNGRNEVKLSAKDEIVSVERPRRHKKM